MDIKSDFKEGISALKSKNVDCVILDINMSSDILYKQLESAKKDSGLENVPVIIFTGKDLSTSEEQQIKLRRTISKSWAH